MQSKATSLETQNEIDKNEITLFDLSLLHIESLSIFYESKTNYKKNETMWYLDIMYQIFLNSPLDASINIDG